MNRIIGGIGGLIGLLLIYGAINLVLVGGQKALHAGDQTRLDEIMKQLEVEKVQINSLVNELTALGRTLDDSDARISDLDSRLLAIEKNYPGGAPSALYGDYTRMLNERNALVDPHNANLSRYKTAYADYSSRIAKYKSLVDEGEALSKKIGSTWVIVPIPRLGSRK